MVVQIVGERLPQASGVCVPQDVTGVVVAAGAQRLPRPGIGVEVGDVAGERSPVVTSTSGARLGRQGCPSVTRWITPNPGAGTAQDPDCLAYIDEAEIIGEFSHCFRDLKLPSEALRFAEQAVAQTDPQHARTLGFCRMVLAQGQFLNGDLENAVATATLAVDAGESLQSARFVRYVEDFRREISAYSSAPMVRALNERVVAARAELEE